MSFYYIENSIKDAAFHFAVEEYFLRHTTHNVVMIWQTGDCVMLGKNQLLGAEIDLELAEKKGVQITRRSSGGGTIFTDRGTFLFTLICPAPSISADKSANTANLANIPKNFKKAYCTANNSCNTVNPELNSVNTDNAIDTAKHSSFVNSINQVNSNNSSVARSFVDIAQGDSPLLRAKKLASLPVVDILQRLGANAQLLGRNDILIDDKKVSGIAQYAVNGRICTHGSLLFDADLDMLGTILTPDSEKLAKKAVCSVKSRVTNIANHVNCDLAEFIRALRQGFLDFFNGKGEENGEISEGGADGKVGGCGECGQDNAACGKCEKSEAMFLGRLTPYTLTDSELAEIEVIRQEKYAHKLWVFGEPIPQHMPLVSPVDMQNYAAGGDSKPASCEYMFSAGVITSERNTDENSSKTDGNIAENKSDKSVQNTVIRESFHTKARFEAGGIDLFIDTDGGVIRRIFIRGDFLATEDIAELENHLQDTPLEKNAMDRRLDLINLTPYLGGITKEEFLSLIF